MLCAVPIVADVTECPSDAPVTHDTRFALYPDLSEMFTFETRNCGEIVERINLMYCPNKCPERVWCSCDAGNWKESDSFEWPFPSCATEPIDPEGLGRPPAWVWQAYRRFADASEAIQELMTCRDTGATLFWTWQSFNCPPVGDCLAMEFTAMFPSEYPVPPRRHSVR